MRSQPLRDGRKHAKRPRAGPGPASPMEARAPKAESGREAECKGCGRSETCPCAFPEIEPCMEDCSCADQFMSAGCARCCSYGSREQRLSNARRLVRILEKGLKRLS